MWRSARCNTRILQRYCTSNNEIRMRNYEVPIAVMLGHPPYVVILPFSPVGLFWSTTDH
ncbi:hypothetical protein BDV35DRAFT_371271 [Aspergillus flavus]|uniref:Uncharacterized protein n=1 Tax=Aspergillus flavus TaxID=5059 RepID=A0A5N6GF66_ASPFL|nr:hypothetical protein BDV35DRAFT_371271 [Aspergillus flavus]